MEKQTVLLVEDEKDLLESYFEVLTNSGFNVLKAADGYIGLELLKKNVDKIDLMVLDLMMPGIDGLEVLRTINGDKDSYGESPILVLTNMTSEKVIKEAFDLGAVSYLIKSELDYGDLETEVKKLLGKD